MTKREYAQEIAEQINGKVVEVEKANGIVQTGVTRQEEGSNISANVYIDKMYEDEMSIDEAAEAVDKILKENRMANIEITQFTDYEQVRPMLRARLYNNKTKAEVYKSAKGYGFDDLIIVPYINVKSTGFAGIAGAKVTKTLLEQWGVTERTVIDIALNNSAKETKIMSMRDTMREMMSDMTDEMFDMMFSVDEGMTVLSNTSKVCGAISAITARKELQKRFPNGYVILPSSIHEVIAIPLNENVTENELNNMVNEVNDTQVPPEEVLGTKAYIFKGVA